MTHAMRHMLSTYWCLHFAYLARQAVEEHWDEWEFDHCLDRPADEYLTYARQHEQIRWLHEANGS